MSTGNMSGGDRWLLKDPLLILLDIDCAAGQITYEIDSC